MKQTEFNELANSTCSSSGSMNSKQKPIKEKSVKQLTFEAKEVNDNEEHDMGTSHLETKRMDARWYRSLFRKPKNGKVEVPQRVQPDIFRNETAQMPESRNPLLDEDLVRNDVGHDGEKSTHSKRNGIMLDTGSDLSTTLADDDDSNLIPSRLRDNIVGTGGSCSKRRRLDCDPVVSSNPSTTELQDGVDTDASVLQKEYPVNSPKEVTKHTCLICKSGGQLLGNCLLQDSWFRLCWLIIMVMLWLPNPRLLEKDQMRVQAIVPPQLKQAYLCRIVVI